MAVLSAWPTSAREKTDVLVMRHGDRLTCEIKSLSADTLYISLDYALGTVAVDWFKVDHLESKAEELQPDIVLMDMGLPELNGIDAARQIMKIAPHSRIVFVTQESSPEVVEETMRLRAYGYVLKSDIGTALLRAVDCALESKGFFWNRNGHASFPREKTPLSEQT